MGDATIHLIHPPKRHATARTISILSPKLFSIKTFAHTFLIDVMLDVGLPLARVHGLQGKSVYGPGKSP